MANESLSERVAALEAERDEWRDKTVKLSGIVTELQIALAKAGATARVEGAREALTRAADNLGVAAMATGNGLKQFRDREYPAAPRASEGERCSACNGTREFVSDSGAKLICRACRPTPQAAPEPLRLAVEWEWVGTSAKARLVITPADARRIVQMGGRDA